MVSFKSTDERNTSGTLSLSVRASGVKCLPERDGRSEPILHRSAVDSLRCIVVAIDEWIFKTRIRFVFYSTHSCKHHFLTQHFSLDRPISGVCTLKVHILGVYFKLELGHFIVWSLGSGWFLFNHKKAHLKGSGGYGILPRRGGGRGE